MVLTFSILDISRLGKSYVSELFGTIQKYLTFRGKEGDDRICDKPLQKFRGGGRVRTCSIHVQNNKKIRFLPSLSHQNLKFLSKGLVDSFKIQQKYSITIAMVCSFPHIVLTHTLVTTHNLKLTLLVSGRVWDGVSWFYTVVTCILFRCREQRLLSNEKIRG